MSGSKKKSRGFTLIELLTVIAVIGLLAAIFIPRFWLARDKAALSGCIQNLRNLATCLQVYANDNDQFYPAALGDLTPNWISVVPTCPYAGRNTYTTGYTKVDNPPNYTMVCKGDNHNTVGLLTDQPYYVFGVGFGP